MMEQRSADRCVALSHSTGMLFRCRSSPRGAHLEALRLARLPHTTGWRASVPAKLFGSPTFSVRHVRTPARMEEEEEELPPQP